MRYDPGTGPDAAQWLQADEDERLGSVRSWITDFLNPHGDEFTAHEVFLTVLETQIASADPAFVVETLDRLTSEGLDRTSAVMSMAGILGQMLSEVIRQRSAMDMNKYHRMLSALDAETIGASWLSDMQVEGLPAPFDKHLQEQLEAFAGRHARDGVLPFPAMAGLIFAVVCGPRFAPPSEWMPLVLGDAGFTSDEEAREITAALLALVNWSVDTSNCEDSDPIPPDCQPDPHPMANLQEDSRFGQWCKGWALGMLTCELDWSNALTSDDQADTFSAIMMTFSFFATRKSAEDIYTDFDKAVRPASLDALAAELHQQIPDAVAAFMELGREVRETLAQLPPPKIPVRSTKIGRNHPCPCGSGKKYKKCCGGPGR